MSDDQWAPAEPTPLEQVVATTAPIVPPGPVQVEGYTDLVEVARGGDSIVYRAHQPSVGRDVAIKVLSVADAATAARFQRELEITVRLGRQHPYIVNVLDTTTTAAGEPCLVMDLHDLGSLHDRLRAHGPLPVSEVVAAGTAVADALAFAHHAGVLHRDVKPQNILLLPTSYVLSDFGIARMADSGHTATMDRFSYRHASPQVLDGMEPTQSDDLWSLGSTLFTLLDGRAPFAATDPHDDTALSYLRRVRTGQRRPLTRTDLPTGLRELIDSCLQPDPQHRPGSAAAALTVLRGLRTEERSWDPVTPGPNDGAGPEASRVSGASAGSADDDAAHPDATVARTGVGDPAEQAHPAPVHRAGRVLTGPAATGPAAPEPATTGPATPEPATPEPAALPAAAGNAADGHNPAGAGNAPAGIIQAVAPSALAHVPAGDGPAAPRPEVDPDAAATGMITGVDEAADPPQPEEPEGSPSSPPVHWRRIVAFFSGVLLTGLALGVGFTLVRQATAPDEPPEPPATDVDVPVSTDDVPNSDGPAQAPVGDPRFAPQSLVLVDRGTSAELSWVAPEQDVDYYLVVLVTDDGAGVEVVRMVAAHLTEYTVGGLDPDNPYECYAVIGYAQQDGDVHTGSSPLECR